MEGKGSAVKTKRSAEKETKTEEKSRKEDSRKQMRCGVIDYRLRYEQSTEGASKHTKYCGRRGEHRQPQTASAWVAPALTGWPALGSAKTHKYTKELCALYKIGDKSHWMGSVAIMI